MAQIEIPDSLLRDFTSGRPPVVDPLERAGRALEQTHEAMAGQIARLTAELEAARLARREEHAERGRLLGRLASLLDTLPGGVVIVDRQGRITEYNPQAARLLGEPLEGENWAAVEARGYYPEDDTLEIHGRRLSLDASQLGDSGETIILLSDITRQHTLQDEASRRQRLVALGEMAARLAHQIRTPLSSTTLYMSLLDNDLPRDQRSEICSNVREQLQHMEAQITAMLSFVRGSGRVTGPVSLAGAINDAVHSCTADIETTDAELDIETCGPEIQLEACHDEWVSAFSNLISNALEASGPAPRLEIRCQLPSDRLAVVRFSDRGRGIDPKVIDRIFDPFFTTRAAGTGLGLAVVANTVRQLGGTIRAANRPGGGTEFTLLLPVKSRRVTDKEVA